ncbi:MAG: SgcJ/EcaC family oxidoreductase [Pseudomonadota bacterium]
MVPDPDDFVPAFTAAWMARDGDALAALFAEDADFVNVVGIWWEDRAAIAKAHSYALESFFADTRLVAGRIKRRDLGDVTILHARMSLSGQRAPDGTEAGSRTTILTFVLQRRPEGWTCVSAQNTDVVPGAETQLSQRGTLSPEDYR